MRCSSRCHAIYCNEYCVLLLVVSIVNTLLRMLLKFTNLVNGSNDSVTNGFEMENEMYLMVLVFIDDMWFE